MTSNADNSAWQKKETMGQALADFLECTPEEVPSKLNEDCGILERTVRTLSATPQAAMLCLALVLVAIAKTSAHDPNKAVSSVHKIIDLAATLMEEGH